MEIIDNSQYIAFEYNSHSGVREGFIIAKGKELELNDVVKFVLFLMVWVKNQTK